MSFEMIIFRGHVSLLLRWYVEGTSKLEVHNQQILWVYVVIPP